VAAAISLKAADKAVLRKLNPERRLVFVPSGT
jgi:hypothetical protein